MANLIPRTTGRVGTTPIAKPKPVGGMQSINRSQFTQVKPGVWKNNKTGQTGGNRWAMGGGVAPVTPAVAPPLQAAPAPVTPEAPIAPVTPDVPQGPQADPTAIARGLMPSTDPNVTLGGKSYGDIGDLMFNGTRAIDSGAWMRTPGYESQKKAGMGDLEKLYAARGLTGGGAEIAGNAKFVTDYNAKAFGDWQDQSNLESNRFFSQKNADADRLNNITQYSSSQQERQGNEAARRQEFLLNMMNGNSENAMDRAYKGNAQSQQLLLDQALANGEITKADYPKILARIQAGGGGGTPPPTGSAPAGPDYTTANAYDAYTGNKNTQGYTDILGKLFGGAINYFSK